MSEYRESMKEEFKDKEYREAYADDFLNTKIATQIRAIREQRGLTQRELGELIGTKQEGVSRLENVNHANWSIATLKRIAHAFDARLNVSIETYGSLLDEAESFSRESLERPSFEEDAAFKDEEIAVGVGAGQQVSSGLRSMLTGEHRESTTVVDMVQWIKNHPKSAQQESSKKPDSPASIKDAFSKRRA